MNVLKVQSTMAATESSIVVVGNLCAARPHSWIKSQLACARVITLVIVSALDLSQMSSAEILGHSGSGAEQGMPTGER